MRIRAKTTADRLAIQANFNIPHLPTMVEAADAIIAADLQLFGGSHTGELCPWINELRGAMDYAAFSFLQRDVKVTHYAYYNAERVEGRRIQLTNADQSRTFAAIHIHENRLYIFEGTVPPGAPPPGLFQQSLGFIDEEGIRVRYDTIYANMYPPPARVQYGERVTGEQVTGAPDLSGVPMGGRRRFTDGPFAGQTWGVDGQGGVYLIQDADGRNLPLSGPRAAVPAN